MEYNIHKYTSSALPQTHPDKIGAVGRIFGMNPASMRKCRVLELGCGDGNNLIPMAQGNPESEFMGIDLSEMAVSRGRAMLDKLKLNNLTLAVGDILEFDTGQGPFDYIILHGIYSWVPDVVKERILEICNECLTPQGIAYISYNTYPGFHSREVVRNLMAFHVKGFDDPEMKIAQAKSFLSVMSQGSVSKQSPYSKVLAEELEYIQQLKPEQQDNYIYFDYLSSINDAFYFEEFMERASAKNLRFLGESDYFEMQDGFLNPETRETIQKLCGNDIVRKEQAMDFLKGRKFRQTLLCKKDVVLTRSLHPDRMKEFYFSSSSNPMDVTSTIINYDPLKILSQIYVKFQKPRGSYLEVENLLARVALAHLAHVWPRQVSFNDLLDEGKKIRNECFQIKGKPLPDTKDDEPALADTLFSAISANIVGFHMHCPDFADSVSQRPKASPCAVVMAESSTKVTNLFHRSIVLKKELERPLIKLLDGEKTIDEIWAALKNDYPDLKIEEVKKRLENFTKTGLMVQ